jgi:hypothetical protein
MTAKKPLALAVARYTIFRISNVWTGGVLQEKNLETAALGLAPMYPAYLWSNSKAPGHYGYKRASDLISGKASKLGCSDPQFSVAPGRPVLHCVVHALADLGGKCD